MKLIWRAGWGRWMNGPPIAVPEEELQFRTPLAEKVAAAVSSRARERLIAAADEIMAGRWRVFEVQRDDLVSPDWFLDPRSGRRAPDRAFAFSIDHRDESRVGNAKYVWELSRHQHLTVLAAAYFLTRDGRYADRVFEHLTSWWGENPFLTGVHWTSGVELGIRLLSWVWIRRLLAGSPMVAEQFERNPMFLCQLHWHQRYLATFPSHGSSANNHLIAEAAGQFAAACAFPYFPQSAAWRRQAADTVRRELALQTFACGLNREQASAYHGFVLELGLAAALEGQAAGWPLEEETWSWIVRMTDALAAVVDVALQPPRQGDTDDASGLLLDPPDYQRWASLLATGRQLFGMPDWWPGAPADDIRTALWTALAGVLPRAPARPTSRRAQFREAGLTIVRAGADTADEIWCAFDHGPLGFLSIAAHAHADALSVECRCGGVEILADPGTYGYYGEPEWRAFFRSTAAHNALQVAGVNQSVTGGAFLWVRHARTRLVAAEALEEGPKATCCAEHDGYARLRPPAIHRRQISLDRHARVLSITDQLLTRGPHDCRLSLHLGPGIAVQLTRASATLRWSTPDGRTKAAVLELPGELEWSAVSGQLTPPLGWYSPGFGWKQPSTTLIGSGSMRAELVLVTRLEFAGTGRS